MAKTKKPNLDGLSAELRAEFDEIAAALDRAKKRIKFWTKFQKEPLAGELIEWHERRIEEAKESLEVCEKKDLDQLQARIHVHRDVLKKFDDLTSENDLKIAEVQMKRFEDENALFLSGEDPKSKKEEAKKLIEKAESDSSEFDGRADDEDAEEEVPDDEEAETEDEEDDDDWEEGP